MIKKILKKLLFIEILKRMLGLKFYDYLKHSLRYYSPFPINYNVNNEINFGIKKANNFFIDELKRSKTYLEYGSGSSTFLAYKLKKNFYSIEGDKNFYKYMKKKIKYKNILLKSLDIVKDSSIPIYSKFAYDVKKINNKQIVRIENYCNGILREFDEKKIIPDLVLVDGRYRNLCGLSLYNFFKNKNVKFKIIFDDYILRKNYHTLEKIFEIEIFGRFGVAENLKSNVDNLEDIIKKSYYDCR